MAESIIKSGRRKGFTTVFRSVAQDPRISLKARGLFLLMQSLPDNWSYSISGLAAMANTGKDQIRSALKELTDVGYLVKEQAHDSGGKFTRNVFILQDEAPSPLSENPTTVGFSQAPSSGKPSTEKPTTEKPSTDFPTVQNTEVQIQEVPAKNCGYPGEGTRKNLRGVPAENCGSTSKSNYNNTPLYPPKGDGSGHGGPIRRRRTGSRSGLRHSGPTTAPMCAMRTARLPSVPGTSCGRTMP